MSKCKHNNSSNSTASSGGIGVLGVLQIIFIVLKVLDLIGWSWWTVFIPTFISIGLAILFVIIPFIIILITNLKVKKDW